MSDQHFPMLQWAFQGPNAFGFQSQLNLQSSLEQYPHDNVEMTQPDAPQSRSRGPRSKYGPLAWDRHRKTLQEMFFGEKCSLPEMMRVMEEKHSFLASYAATPILAISHRRFADVKGRQKLYKDKFKEWNWHKNLPARQAQYMTAKAGKRMRNEKKDTVFVYGVTTWTKERAERTLSRAKKPCLDLDDIQDLKTPDSVSYKTPRVMVLSPDTLQAAGDEEEEEDDDLAPESRTSFPDQQVISLHDSVASPPAPLTIGSVDGHGGGTRTLSEGLSLSWKGFTRSDLLALFDSAKSHRERGDVRVAKKLFLQALEVFRYVVGPVHENSTKVAYALASLSSKRSLYCISTSSDSRINAPNAQQHIMHAVELLNGWNRPEDALGLLSRAKELLIERRNGDSSSDAEEDDLELADVSGLITVDSSSRTIDFAHKRTTTSADQAVEGLLLLIMDQCKLNPSQLIVQHLKAKAELLRLYDECNTVDEHAACFTDAESLFLNCWDQHCQCQPELPGP
ncbi:hypothetical protein QBC38DRAFT_521751 [Podospora fimiseda]|uniref:Clr5 domain-containing protein n=1 Tax=Podospora fimiseda TaxID=252190 RepID=A0AAN6YM17_9PEZI|nr:hypothetical protein QBC38DRAFT_521751 [Podospora fimiseda]